MIVDNPLVAISLHFKDGSGLRLDLDKPVSQLDAMAELGRLAMRFSTGLNIIPLVEGESVEVNK